MTPLEEIERTIESTRDQPGFNEVNRAVLLSNLYQARALERLAVTVRAIGVQWQQYADIVVPIMQRVDAHAAERGPAYVRKWKYPHAYAPYAPEFNGSPCRCGQPRVDPIHPAELEVPPANICQYCGKPLGEQHSPHCSRQGKVAVDSLGV